jgi:hypothetical protein
MIVFFLMQNTFFGRKEILPPNTGYMRKYFDQS